ncbi:MAG: DNA repair protein RecO [Flavobacteriales bacterium]|nr:DNA repair protein RecO [Flavobacteriales bacterium]
MVRQDEAIFLRKTKYGETGFVLSLLTKDSGVQSFILQGIKGKRKSLIASLHPLAILDIEYLPSKSGTISRLLEANILDNVSLMRADMTKSAMSFFLSEIIWKSLPENENYPHLYAYIKASIHFLNGHKKAPSFHLIFMMRFTKFLGFYPSGEYKSREFFDLREGQFTTLRPSHLHYLEPPKAKFIWGLLNAHFDESLKLGREESRELLEVLVEYYHIHLEKFGQLKTLRVLHEVFD